MRKKSIHWYLLLVFLLTVGIVAGCSDSDTTESVEEEKNDSETNDEAGEEDELFVFGEETLEISMFGNYDWYTMPGWGDDVATAWIKENKKVDITAIDGGGNAEQKLTTMIAGDELPDFIWTDRGASVERLREGGALVPLDPYLDKYTNLRDWFGEEGINMLRSDDGKLYQFPNWYNSSPFGNAGYVVNKGIYEDLGSPPLETTEDLYEYLQLVKENYPDVIPFETGIDGQGINVLYSAFAEGESPANINNVAVPNGDQLTSIFMDENYTESLQYVSKLFREGLITQDALTQDQDMVIEKVTAGNIAVFASASPTDHARTGHYDLLEEDPDGGYFMIHPIHKEGLDPNEVYPGSYNMMGWNVSVITKGAEDPEKVFAFLDWLTGPEGQSSLIFGPEGEYWDGFDEEGFPQFTEKYYEDPEGLAKVEEDTANFQWNGNSNFLDTAKANFEESLPEEHRNWTTHWQNTITWDTQYDATQYLNISPIPESEEGIIQQRVGEVFEEARAKAVYAQSDEEVEQIMEEAETAAQDVGYQQLLEFQTEKWQENLAIVAGE
ncbi:ABC-type glycerol-3-phosphate transport system, substrate-binding protein [Gracilibacillus orientalis]|uniref:ABC-type glycerol-3-phosphate transport system, substrate-binding protein n=1 Tax=Gracilibacillus orientalis TaxID=334253 RepID=A0A1I4HLI4_9BACI|nr:extracellular solute-binding protein [Gracilibacillus orientalis]SFL42276.1 ABC-type glycerol-3-phosphate transport system, substrate-binding protein [Gracilibacillus orientalis]